MYTLYTEGFPAGIEAFSTLSHTAEPHRPYIDRKDRRDRPRGDPADGDGRGRCAMAGVFEVLLRRPRAGVQALRQIADRTPPQRDRHVDLLRAIAIAMVVLGHWLSVAVTYDGRFGGDSVLAVAPWAHPLTWLFQVMPVFFLVGGFSNAVSLASYRQRGGTAVGWILGRTDRLIRPTTMFLLVLGGAALLSGLLGVDWTTVSVAVWLACIPLWFLIVYFTVTFLTPVMLGLHRRAGLAVPVVLAALVGLGDVAGLLLGLPLVGAANYVFAWLAIHQLGIAWQQGTLPTRQTVALPMAVGGLTVLVLLTVVGPYPVSMVTVPGEQVQNTAPPTLALLALAVTQTGVALLLRDRANRWLRRPRPWMIVVAVNSVIMTIFLWHMTSVVIGIAALYPTGLMPQPAPGSAEWLLLRLPWLAVLGVILAALVAVFGRVERRTGPKPDAGQAPSCPLRTAATITGSAAVVAGLLGAAVAGPDQRGPTGQATQMLLLYVAGAALLRTLRHRPGS